jgi:hypothetical protein
MSTEVPNAVYTQDDFTAIGLQIRRGIFLAAVLAAVAFVLIGFTLAWRIQWATMAVTFLWGALTIFLWGMKLTPPLAYRRHLRETHQGLSRQVIGKLVRFDVDPTFREGSDFYAFLVNVGPVDDPEDERLFYWDAQKPRPHTALGNRVEITSHGNDIIGLRLLEDGGDRV